MDGLMIPETQNYNMTQEITTSQQGVTVNYYIIHQKKTFLDVEELSQEIPYAKKSIYNMISNGFFIEGVHYTKVNNKVIFYYPSIEALFKPVNAAEPAHQNVQDIQHNELHAIGNAAKKTKWRV